MNATIPAIDYPQCMACGVCVIVCPFTCFDLSKVGIDAWNKAYPVLASPERCTGCAICQKACPVDVIEMQQVITETA